MVSLLPIFSNRAAGLTKLSLALAVDTDPQATADRIISKVIPLGQRFYPSQSAFPLREYSTVFHTALAPHMPLTI